MTGHERVMRAINHQEPDKLPMDCGSMRSTGIMALVYNRLKKFLHIESGKTKVYDMIQQLAIPEQWYLDMFQIDSIDLAREFSNNDEDWILWNLPDGSAAYRPKWVDIKKNGGDWVCYNDSGVEVGRMNPNLVYFTQTNHPLKGVDDFDKTTFSKKLNEVIWNVVADPIWRLKEASNFKEDLRV
ncbi:MAG: hypothetical protein WC224_04850, partial [Sphaerochaetaceae bacterium]